MNTVSNLIFHCNHCDANTAFITIHESTAAAPSRPSGLLNAKFTFKGTFHTNHFRTYSSANECPTTLSLTVFTVFHTGVTAEALRAKIDRKRRFRCNAVTLIQNFRYKGSPSSNHFLHGQLGQWMPYNFAADSFHKKKLCSRLSSSEVRYFYGNRPFCVFQPPFGKLRGNVRRSS